MLTRSARSILGRFANAADRPGAALDLAEHLGVDEALLFVRDPEIDAYLPAPGLAQTLGNGLSWQTFLASCSAPGVHRAHAPSMGDDPPRPAVAISFEQGATLCLVGGRPDLDRLDALLPGLPLLAALLVSETSARLATGAAEVARAGARHARSLATALESARAEQQRALRESESLNEQLQDANRRKDEFLAMLGHELRNPMAAIAGAFEVMRAPAVTAAQRAHAEEIMSRQTRQLVRLVDDLLDAARISRGKIALRCEPLDVGDVTRRAIEATRSLVVARRHDLRTHGGQTVLASADPARLEQMVVNLIANAAKYTDPGGHIDVYVERQEGDAVVRVTDSGIGIEPAMLDRVFEPFVQVEATLERSRGGMGIGLTLVKTLAELHGGRVEVQSTQGKGSTFSIRLPALDAATALRTAAPAPSHGKVVPRRVLVVDDNHDSAEMIAELLQASGHDTRLAPDGHAALDVASHFRPEVILLDIGLPGIDGYEVARRLRRMPETEGTRIVAVSGYGADHDRALSREAGFDAHLVKPVELGELERLLAL